MINEVDLISYGFCNGPIYENEIMKVSKLRGGHSEFYMELNE